MMTRIWGWPGSPGPWVQPWPSLWPWLGPCCQWPTAATAAGQRGTIARHCPRGGFSRHVVAYGYTRQTWVLRSTAADSDRRTRQCSESTPAPPSPMARRGSCCPPPPLRVFPPNPARPAAPAPAHNFPDHSSANQVLIIWWLFDDYLIK